MTIQLIRDGQDTKREALSGALLYRADPMKFALSESARQWVGVTLLDICKESLSDRGIRWRGFDRQSIVGMALETTSDFPGILANVANKTLRAGYEMSESMWKLISARRTAPDFKTVSELTLDGGSDLELVPESGEFHYGKLVEGKQTWNLATYGKIISISRQAIINDDLSAFTRTPFLMGQKVAKLEADTVWAIITANGNLADGHPLFDATNHKNVVGSGATIGIDSLGSMRVLLGTQTSPGGDPLNITPRFLVAPAALGQLAEQYCSAAYQATQPSNINPLAGRLTPVIEARLDVSDDDPWYLFGDPNSPNGAVLIYAYLEGQEGPRTETWESKETDGVSIKIAHDFAASAVDFRGAVQNPGASD